MTDSSRIWVSYGLGGGVFDVGKSFTCGARPSVIHAASLGSGAPADLVVGGMGVIVVLSGLSGESFSAMRKRRRCAGRASRSSVSAA